MKLPSKSAKLQGEAACIKELWSIGPLVYEVKLFAVARELIGSASVAVVVHEPATVGKVKQALASAYPQLAALVPSLLFAVNSCYAGDSEFIPAGADLAAIPPVSGGSS